jgi:glutathione synthase/RimK-type ligase-like ATP-grasp enzyme
MTAPKPIAIYHEHPSWFDRLFAELDRRGTPYVRIDAAAHRYDPSEREVPYSLVFNRASPSAYLRGHGQVTFHTLHWLRHLERLGVPVVNGSRPYSFEISKAAQAEMLQKLGLPYPASRVINHPSQAPAAAAELRFPVLVKANIGGSGAGITRFDTPGELAAAAAAGALDFGVDHVALVQELVPFRDGHITRLETLGGRFLYALDVFPPAGSYNLCPGTMCRTEDAPPTPSAGASCTVEAEKKGSVVRATSPPAALITAVERIAAEIGLDIGGIELFVDDRDGLPYFYDINALSNFVADAPRVVGFDPFVRLGDFLEQKAGILQGSEVRP